MEELKLAAIQKLELKEEDILLVTFHNSLMKSNWDRTNAYFEELTEKLPFKNKIVIIDGVTSVSILSKGG